MLFAITLSDQIDVSEPRPLLHHSLLRVFLLLLLLLMLVLVLVVAGGVAACWHTSTTHCANSRTAFPE